MLGARRKLGDVVYEHHVRAHCREDPGKRFSGGLTEERAELAALYCFDKCFGIERRVPSGSRIRKEAFVATARKAAGRVNDDLLNTAVIAADVVCEEYSHGLTPLTGWPPSRHTLRTWIVSRVLM